MSSIAEKGAALFEGVKLLLCENPLPPLEAAITAAEEELPRGNFYTEPYSAPLRAAIADQLKVPERLVHINAGSELILRQLFGRLGRQVHLLTPTYPLFPEIAGRLTETPLLPEDDFGFDLASLQVPDGTSLVVIVNPNNPNGGVFHTAPLPELIEKHPEVYFLVDEAFIEFGGTSVARLVSDYRKLIVTRTFSKAHSLAGFRVGYAIAPPEIADWLNQNNDAYPLARPSQAAALATLANMGEIEERVKLLKGWTSELGRDLRRLGVRTYPTETYFFLADFTPLDGQGVADRMAERKIYLKPLRDPRLGSGLVRITTATPEENEVVLSAFAGLLGRQG